MPDAAYFRDWRRAHPEYRTRQNALRNERRRRLGRGDRTSEYAGTRRRRGDRALPPIPSLHQGHPLFDAARTFVTRVPSGLRILHDPIVEDLVSVAVLALIENEDPKCAVDRFHYAERAWRRMTLPLIGEWAA